MSLNGMQFAKVAGSQLARRPSAARIWFANVTHSPAPCDVKKLASDGFNPDGRKKLVKAAATHGAPEALTPQGAPPAVAGSAPTPSGPSVLAPEVGSVKAVCQFASSACGRTALALIGRFRCRPPLKLYSRLRDRLCPMSCSNVKFACCEYGYWNLFDVGNPKGWRDSGTPACREGWISNGDGALAAGLKRC